jgi:hypothetical protein
MAELVAAGIFTVAYNKYIAAWRDAVEALLEWPLTPCRLPIISYLMPTRHDFASVMFDSDMDTTTRRGCFIAFHPRSGLVSIINAQCRTLRGTTSVSLKDLDCLPTVISKFNKGRPSYQELSLPRLGDSLSAYISRLNLQTITSV